MTAPSYNMIFNFSFLFLIDYEEELDFSLRVPSRNAMDADAVSQVSHDQIETANETTKNVNTTAPGPQVVIAEEASVTEVDHKVTVTIQKPNIPETDVTAVTEEDIRKQPQQQPQPRESHVTVIKVQEEIIKETKGKKLGLEKWAGLTFSLNPKTGTFAF